MPNFALHSFCACGHIGWRHNDEPKHPCCSPGCDCDHYHHETIAVIRESALPEARRYKQRLGHPSRSHPMKDSG